MNKEAGFSLLKLIFVLAFIIIILSVLGVSLQNDVVENETVQENATFVGEILSDFWQNTLKPPLTYFWTDIFLPLLWGPFVENLTNINGGGETVFDNFDLPDFEGGVQNIEW